eukprot:gene13221-4039_t
MEDEIGYVKPAARRKPDPGAKASAGLSRLAFKDSKKRRKGKAPNINLRKLML